MIFHSTKLRIDAPKGAIGHSKEKKKEERIADHDNPLTLTICQYLDVHSINQLEATINTSVDKILVKLLVNLLFCVIHRQIITCHFGKWNRKELDCTDYYHFRTTILEL